MAVWIALGASFMALAVVVFVLLSKQDGEDEA